ncbi:GUN4 domain-containing protein [Prochlorococcus sp. MIT 1341]|uniref:GUN4 domain-containing protein n=1 Tax=Prochlorococcus sp. MIT 1341 TaxID=3096221 RepID=UPI002A763178|nr:GUN4 domain-containing protein [Prochlorococcus sp. MIT 1341]
MVSASSSANSPSINELLEKFKSSSVRQKRTLIKEVEKRSAEIAGLGEEGLIAFNPESDDWAAGWILQILHRHEPEALKKILSRKSSGWFNAPSSIGIDYAPLQEALLEERFEDADRLTSSTLRKLAGINAENRGYVYFTEVAVMAGLDLVTIDRLWIAYSQGRFGFSVQARILKALNGRYDRLWPRIGWKKDAVWTRYPTSFTWSLDAPEGHMPLVNQLRGVRLIDAILNHPSLSERC